MKPAATGNGSATAAMDPSRAEWVATLLDDQELPIGYREHLYRIYRWALPIYVLTAALEAVSYWAVQRGRADVLGLQVAIGAAMTAAIWRWPTRTATVMRAGLAACLPCVWARLVYAVGDLGHNHDALIANMTLLVIALLVTHTVFAPTAARWFAGLQWLSASSVVLASFAVSVVRDPSLTDHLLEVLRFPLVSGAVAALATVVSHLHTERSRLAAECRTLVDLAHRDGLTGLLNRRGFNEALDREQARTNRHGDPATLVLLDVDHFKHVNDNYGHAVGDRVLRDIARTLTDACRATDLIARWGGEEIALLLTHATESDATLVAERLRTRIGAQDFGVAPVSVSMGVTQLRRYEEAQAALERADAALYAAKAAGRNRVARAPADAV